MQDTLNQHDTPSYAELLTEDQQAFLRDAFARNRAAFGGFRMVVDDDDDDDQDDDDKQQDDDKSQDDDKVDWKAKFDAQQRINRQLERRTKKDQARIKELAGADDKGADKPTGADDKKPEVDADKIRAEAKAEAEQAALNDRVEDKIEAKAAKFADPEDIVPILLRSHSYDDFLDENNKIDVEAITEALKDLAEKKPHLLAQGGGFQGGADGGARKETKGRPKNLADAVGRHYQKS